MSMYRKSGLYRVFALILLLSVGLSAGFATQMFTSLQTGEYNNTEHNSTALTLALWDDVEKDLLADQQDDGYIDMTGNVVLFHLNETSGTILDYSGNDHDGTNEGATYSASGRLGNALDFDGSNDYLSFDSVTEELDDVFTVALWLKADSSTDAGLITFHDSANNNKWRLEMAAGYASIEGSNGYVDISDGEWHYVVAQTNGSRSGIFVDGYLDREHITITTDLIDTDRASVGQEWDSGGPSNFFNGIIDEVAIWNRTLTRSEIYNIYQRQSAKYGAGNNGTYTSDIYTASADSSWNTFEWESDSFQSYLLYAVDSSSDIWKSIDQGFTWTLVLDDYNGGVGNDADGLAYDGNYFYVIDNQDVWRGADFAQSFTKINDDFNSDSGSSSKFIEYNGSALFIIDGNEDVWVSIDNAITFTKVYDDFNDGNGNIKGMDIDADGTLWVVDSQSDVWNSLDGTSWNLVKDDFNDGEGNSNGAFIVTSQYYYVVEGDDDIWRASDAHGTWTKTSDDYNSGEGQHVKSSTIIGDMAYIFEADEDVWNSTDGITWSKSAINFNGGNGDIKGTITVAQETILDFKIRSCADSSCSGEIWIDIADQSPQTLSISDNQYFQYFVSLETNNYNTAPALYNVTVDYTILNAAPTISILAPEEEDTYTYQTGISLEYEVADSDDNIDSCWYNLDEGSNIIIASCNNLTFDMADDGEYTIYVYVNDTLGEEASDSVTFSVDSIYPSVEIARPENTIYITPLVDINVSSNEEISTWKYSFDDGVSNTTFTPNTTITASEGSNSLIIYCVDLAGNENSSSIDFSVDTTAPIVTILIPEESQYASVPVPLEYEITDVSTIDSCWYSLNEGLTNTTILNCDNSTFSVSDGTYTIYVYANDSIGFFGQDNSTFTVVTTAPAINVNSPDNLWLSDSSNINFNYTVTSGLNLAVCELWSNFTGTFKFNQSNQTLVSNGESNLFNLDNLAEGYYVWQVTCNDSQNREGFSSNATFGIDTINPSVSVDEPTGVYSSTTDISIDYDVSDETTLNCIYNVTFAVTENTVIPHTETDCTDITFAVDTDGEYTFNLYVEDLAGNANVDSVNFSVDTSSNEADTPAPSGNNDNNNGGGATVVNKNNQNCTEEWSCSTWYNCVNGTQARTCKDVSNCNSIIDKPIETRKCNPIHCSDNIWNYDEESVDCGGNDCDACEYEVDGLTGSIIELERDVGLPAAKTSLIVTAVLAVIIGALLIAKTSMFKHKGKSIRKHKKRHTIKKKTSAKTMPKRMKMSALFKQK